MPHKGIYFYIVRKAFSWDLRLLFILCDVRRGNYWVFYRFVNQNTLMTTGENCLKVLEWSMVYERNEYDVMLGTWATTSHFFLKWAQQ